MRKLVTEVLVAVLVYGSLVLGLVVIDVGWEGSLVLALAAFAALAILRVAYRLRSPRYTALSLLGDGLVIAALAVFANEDDGSWTFLALVLIVAGIVCTSQARRGLTFQIERRVSEADFARERKWVRVWVVAMVTSVLLVLFGVPWWTTIIVSVVGMAFTAYSLRNSFRVVQRDGE